jgi:hypothetical protein
VTTLSQRVHGETSPADPLLHVDLGLFVPLNGESLGHPRVLQSRTGATRVRSDPVVDEAKPTPRTEPDDELAGGRVPAADVASTTPTAF